MQAAIKDILTVVIDIRPAVTRTSRAKSKTTEFGEAFLTDASVFPKCIGLTIWQEALLLFPQLAVEFSAPFVLQATSVRANTYGGKYCFQTTSFTRFDFLETHTSKSERLIKRLIALKKKDHIRNALEQPYSEPLGETIHQLSTIAEFRKAMQSKDAPAEVIFYNIRAVITYIYSELPTIYRSCAVCNRGMPNPNNDSFGCPNQECSNRQGRTTFRYRLTATIRDDSNQMDITIFNTQAEEILRTPATTIQELLSEDTGLSKIQKIFKKGYNRVWTFSFRVTPGNYNFFKTGSYTLNQIEWVPRGFNNPEALLFQPSLRVTDLLIATSSSQRRSPMISKTSPASSKQPSTSETTNTASNSNTLARK